MNRRRFSWTDFQLDKLKKIQKILEELEDYKPLTLKQVYYQMVGKGHIENTKSQYTMLSSGLIKWARIDGFISWDDIEDRVRVFHDLKGWDNKEVFIDQELGRFLEGYRRDLLKTQEKYLEVWIEKDALSSMFSRICLDYTVPVVVCRGLSFLDFLNEFKERLSYKANKIPIILYFGDFDPLGIEMLNAMRITLKEEMGVRGLGFKKIALFKEDIFAYKLPYSPKALKKTDTRAKKHLENYEGPAVELDALRPDILEKKIREAIEFELDMEAFNNEARESNLELDKLNMLKKKITAFINSLDI